MIRGAGEEAGGGGAEERGRAETDDEGGERGGERAVVGQQVARVVERGVGHGHEQEGPGGFPGGGAGAQGEAMEQREIQRGEKREEGGGEPDGEAGKLGLAPVIERREVREGVVGGGEDGAEPREEGVFGLSQNGGYAGKIGGGERAVKLDTAMGAHLIRKIVPAALRAEPKARQGGEPGEERRELWLQVRCLHGKRGKV